MASLWNWLGNQIHGVEAQLNPWDGGQTYDSVVHKKQPQPQPQPQPNYGAINQGLNQGKSWQDISAQTNTPFSAVKSYSQQTRPNYGIPQAAPQPIFNDKMTDPNQIYQDYKQNFTKYSLPDQIKLLQTGAHHGAFDPHQAAQAIVDLGKAQGPTPLNLNPLQSFVAGTVSTGQKALNTLDAAGTGIVGAGKVGYDLLTGNNQAAQQDNATAMQNINSALNSKTITGDQGAFISPATAHGNIQSYAKDITNTTGEVAPWVLPYGKILDVAGKVAAPVENTVMRGLAGSPAAALAAKGAGKLAKATTAGAMTTPVYAGLDASQQYANTGKVNVGQALTHGLQGGTMVAGGELAGAALHTAGKITHQAIQQIPKQFRDIALQRATDSSRTLSMPIKNLTSYEGAPDTNRVAQYKAHIQNGGQIDPLIVMKDSRGKLAVEDGKHRLQALSELGINNAPVKVATPQGLKAVMQGGYVKNPLAKTSDSFDPATQRVIDQAATEYAHSVSSPDQIVKDTVDHWYNYDKSAKGGDMIMPDYNAPYHAQTNPYRITDHTHFYSDFMKVNKKRPTKADYEAEIRKQLQSGRGSLVDQGIADAHGLATNLAKERTALATASSPAPAPAGDVSSVAAPGEPAPQLPTEKYSSPQPQQGSLHASSPENIPSTSEKTSSASSNSGLSNAQPDQAQLLAQLPKPSSVPQTPLETKAPSYPQTTKKRGFMQSVKGSQEVSPEVQKQAGGDYQTRNTQKLADKADARTSQNLPKATESVMSSLDKKKGTLTDQEVANAISVAKRLDSTKNTSQASNIYDKLDEHLRESGRAIQAASLLSRRTPEGLHYSAIKELKRHGVNVTPEFEKQMNAKLSEIKKAPKGSLERNLHIKELQKMVGQQIPSDLADKATSIWKAGLLSGIRTQTGNALSNETFSILHNISNVGAAGLDKLISLKTGVRSKALTGRGLVSGTGRGIKQAGQYLKTGIDERAPLDNKYLQGNREVNFKNKAVSTYVNGIFRLMGAADRPHYYRQLMNSLNELGKVDGINKGLRGTALRQHMKQFVENPPEDKFQIATNEAEQAVLANDTLMSKAAGRIQKLADEAKSPLGKFVSKIAISGIAPFTKVPSAFISRVIDYTPVGAIKEIGTQVSKGKFDQRALVTAVSEAGTGSGLIWLGSQLAQNNMLAGNYPTDPKEQQRWKAQGIQPNSVKIGGNWYSLNYFGPVGMLFAAGSRINDSNKAGDNWLTQQGKAYGGLPSDLMNQSFLQGLNNSLQAVNEPGRYLTNWAKSNAGSVIPTLVNDAANATDSKQRQSNNPLDTIKSRIPGLRETLNPSQDAYGNDLNRKTGAVGTMVNPLRPSQAISNDVKKEVERLHNADPNNKDLQVTPTPIGKSVAFGGKDVTGKAMPQVKLSDQQRYNLQKQVGQAVQNAWGNLIKTKQYQALDDTNKANALDSLRRTVAEAETARFGMAQGVGQYASNFNGKATSVSKNAQVFLTGNPDQSTYAGYATGTNSQNSGAAISPKLNKSYADVLSKYNGMDSNQRKQWLSSQNDAQYQYNLAKYQNDLASGNLSTAQKIKAQTSLAKEKVGAVYPKNVRDLYGLSKSSLYSYLTTYEKGVDKQKLGKQLIAYDNSLANAGIISKPKYANGIAPKNMPSQPTVNVDNISHARQSYVNPIRQSAAKYGVDPKAAMAVAAAEGLGGGVGDNGTSFGPFQLHVGGALPAGKSQAWAESPDGIDYAMQQIAKATKGLSGQAAIQAIVNQFERPADPQGEIAKALAVYSGKPVSLASGSGSGSSGGSGGSSSSSSANSSAKALAAELLRLKLAKKPQQHVGSTSKASVRVPHFTTPALKSVYTPNRVQYTPKVSIKKTKRR